MFLYLIIGWLIIYLYICVCVYIYICILFVLQEVEKEFRSLPGTCTIQDVPIVLYVPLVESGLNSEKLAVCIDVQLGTFLVSMANESE